MAFKTFANGFPLTATDLNTYLMKQTVMVFATASARAADLVSPTEGMVTYREDGNGGTGIIEVYNGTTWVDINDNTAAIPKSIIDATGDLIVGTSADTPARLAVGGNGAILKSDGTSPAWLGVGTTGQVLTVSGGDAVWASVPSAAPTIDAFTSSGTWTVPAGVTKFSAFVMAGGGGGWSGGARNGAGSATGGYGGATGSYTMFQSLSCTPGDVWTVTVGAGGAGDTANVNNSGSTYLIPGVGSEGTASTLTDPDGLLIITSNPSTPNGGSVSSGGDAVTTNMTNAFAGNDGNAFVGVPAQINYYAITSTQGVGSNGTTAPTGTLKGAGGTASHSGTGGVGSMGQGVTSATVLGTAMGNYAWFGGGAGGGAAASNSSTNTVGGAGGNAALGTGGGGGGGGAAVRGSGSGSTGGAGGNGGSGFVAIVY